MKYINIALLVIIVILLIVFFIRLVKLMKSITYTKQHSEIINKDLIEIKDKKREIEDSANSWAFLMLLSTIHKIIKETKKDYKNSKNKRKSKSFAKACLKNVYQISKIKL